MHPFASNFVEIFLERTPSKAVKIGMLPISMELWVFVCNLLPILKKIFSENTDKKSFVNLKLFISYKKECDDHSATWHFYLPCSDPGYYI